MSENSKNSLESFSNEMYHCYSDFGHAWIKVPKTHLVSLGIAEKISKYSYVQGDTAYLEEDWDAMQFMDAMEKQNPSWKLEDHLIEHHSKNNSEIRNFQRYPQ